MQKDIQSATSRRIQKTINTNTLLNKEEERKLLKLAQDGDEDARDELITRNLGLVTKMARYYKPYTQVSFEDLMQEGTLGLFTAINKFDLNKEWRFSTYATWWIRHFVGRYMTNHGRTIRIPARIIDLKRKYLNEKEEYMREFGTEPSKEEMASLLGVSLDKIDEMIVMSSPISSLDFSVQDVNGNGHNSEIGTLGDLIADEEVDTELDVVKDDILEQLKKAINQLDAIEKAILVRFYGLDGSKKIPTKSQLMNEYHLTSLNRFNAILNSAMEKLKDQLGDIETVLDVFDK